VGLPDRRLLIARRLVFRQGGGWGVKKNRDLLSQKLGRLCAPGFVAGNPIRTRRREKLGPGFISDIHAHPALLRDFSMRSSRALSNSFIAYAALRTDANSRTRSDPAAA